WRAASGPMDALSSANSCSRCCASSSTRSCSPSGGTAAGASLAMISSRQSRMLGSCDPGDRGDEFLPALPVVLERRLAFRRDAIEAAAPLAFLLDPAPGDPAAILHAVEQGIERRDVKTQHALRPRGDQLAQLVAVSLLVFEQ